jgi:hypothetical protein
MLLNLFRSCGHSGVRRPPLWDHGGGREVQRLPRAAALAARASEFAAKHGIGSAAARLDGDFGDVADVFLLCPVLMLDR